MKTFADDVEVFVPAELGNAGTYHGLEGFQSWISSWDDAWSDFRMEVKQMEAVGDRHVVAEVSNTGVGVGSGVEVGNTLGWVFSVREDNRLDYLSLQRDLEAAREHARAREAGEA